MKKKITDVTAPSNLHLLN